MVILEKFIEGDQQITIYSIDGVNESHRAVESLQEEIPPEEMPAPPDPKPSLSEIQAQTLLETQYQTVLLEMLSGL